MQTATLRELVTTPAESGQSIDDILAARRWVDLRGPQGNMNSYRSISSEQPEEYRDDCEPFADAISESIEFIPRPFVCADARRTSEDYRLATDLVTIEVSRCNHLPVDLWGTATERGVAIQWDASLVQYSREKIKQDGASVAMAIYQVEVVG